MRLGDLDRRYALCALLLLALLLSPLLAGFTHFTWELAEWAGLIGALSCILLMGAPLRPREATPASLLSLDKHRLIGWIAALAVLMHVLGAVLAEHKTIEYLKASMPLYMWMGALSGVLLLLLVFGSGAATRRLFRSHRGFQATHVSLGCLLLLGLALHVVGTDRYASGAWRRALWLSAMTGSLLLLLIARRRPMRSDAPLKPRLVFGRHGLLMAGVMSVCALSLVALYAGARSARLREPLTSLPHALPLDFPHGKHVQVNCLVCHHNFADNRGFDRCVGCHESARTDLQVGVEARFHMFCLDCHRHPAKTLDAHGPVSGCEICHHPPR